MNERYCKDWSAAGIGKGYISNYIVCPGLCPTCTHFLINENSNWGPYNCNAGSTACIADESCRTNKQYERCKCYQHKQANETKANLNQRKASTGGIFGILLGIIIIPVLLVSNFLSLTGVAGLILLPLIIGYSIFRIYKEKKYAFHILNCIWMFIIGEQLVIEITKSIANNENKTVIVFNIIFYSIILILPSLIRMLVNKIRKSSIGKKQ